MQKNIIFSFISINLLMLPCAYGETDLEQITVTATAVDRHSAIEIPCQIDTIKAKEVSSASLGKALSSIAGVNNGSTGSQAGKPIIRGMGGDRIKVLSNGNSTDFQTFGVRYIATLDPLLASRMEVVRGALGGVVNVKNEISTDIHMYEGQKVAGSLEPFSQYNNTPF